MHRSLACGLVAYALLVSANRAPADSQSPDAAAPRGLVTRPRGDLGTKEIRGRLFDAQRGSAAVIAGARIEYSHSSIVNPGAVGSVVSDASGGFAFSLFLHDTDLIDLRIDAVDQGFYPTRLEYGGLQLSWTSTPIDIGVQPGFCAGDCNQDGTVSIDELILGIRVAVGLLPLGTCDAIDADVDAEVTVGETIAAVERALRGCSVGCGDHARTVCTDP